MPVVETPTADWQIDNFQSRVQLAKLYKRGEITSKNVEGIEQFANRQDMCSDWAVSQGPAATLEIYRLQEAEKISRNGRAKEKT